MVTIRSIVSTVRNALRTVNPDDKISNRMIAHLIYQYATLFVRREADSRKLFRDSDLWQRVEGCMELEPAADPGCKTLYTESCTGWVKSKLPLPHAPYQTIYGPLVQVLTPDARKTYLYKDLPHLRAPREFGGGKNFTIDEKGFIYIPSPLLQQVIVRGVFPRPVQIQPCQSPLDYPLYLPQHLLGDLERTILNDLKTITLPIVEDEKPNLNRFDKGQQISV